VERYASLGNRKLIAWRRGNPMGRPNHYQISEVCMGYTSIVRSCVVYRKRMQIEMTLNRKLRVLIADDIQETRRNTRLMVSLLDNLKVVAIASNGQQALEMAREHHPDIMLMDINMPVMDGLTAAREIHKIAPNIGCIITSAERDPNAFRQAMLIGIQEYLIKPFTVDELEAAVERVNIRLLEAAEKNLQTDQLRKKNESYLKQLAEEYSKAKRTDDQAIEVFEQLADFPGCERRWLQTLAIIYVLRLKWGKLKSLAEKLEQHQKKYNVRTG
jgi:YesN/AraC family two-component response regulator